MRLLVLLNSLNISALRGQRSNMVKLFVRRLKTLWKTGTNTLGDLKSFTLLDLDFVLHALNTDLNLVPLDPEVSNMTPKDFLLGYKAIPVKMAFHDKNKNSIILQNLN